MLELSGILILGILAQWLAWKFKIPAILPLIIIGLVVGPFSTLFTSDGSKLIEPVWNGKNGLFPGESLFNFISLAISLILFEGGLTLKKEEVRNIAPVIYKLITLGSFITLVFGALASHFIMGLNWSISFLFASLIIVTGPTVISPILRNLPIKKDISTILKWESILIDPIGALIAVLVFEWITVGSEFGGNYTLETLAGFIKIIFSGLAIGSASAYGFSLALKNKLVPHYLLNAIILALVLSVFVLSELLAHDSGLLTVVVMGMVLGNMQLESLRDVFYFKETISILLISMLFILLSANINIQDLALIYNWNSFLLFVVVILIIRPVGVFLSTAKSTLKVNEKVFVSWVGPRGIVAAGIASLFGIKLTMRGFENANYITPLVFLIVSGTVLLNATTARFVAKITKVLLIKSEGILIVGASEPARLIASYLIKYGRRVVLIDSNPKHIENAKKINLEAIECDIYSSELTENIELNDIGYLIALTGSNTINEYALEKLQPYFGEEGAYRIISSKELHDRSYVDPNKIISYNDDYINISEVVRDYPKYNEQVIQSKEHYRKLINASKKEKNSIPLFLMDNLGKIHILTANYEKIDVEKGNILMYLGKN